MKGEKRGRVGRGIVRKALDPPTPYSTPAKQASPFPSCLKPLYLCKANRSQASPGLSLGCVLLTSNAMIPLGIARKKKYICKHNIISFPLQQKTPAPFGVLKILAYHNTVAKSQKLSPGNYSYPLYLLNTEKLNKTDSKKKLKFTHKQKVWRSASHDVSESF